MLFELRREIYVDVERRQPPVHLKDNAACSGSQCYSQPIEACFAWYGVSGMCIIVVGK